MNNKYILTIGILIIGGVILAYSLNKKDVNPTPLVTQNNNVTYTIFSSLKAGFTFEYPSTWIYDEKADPYDAKATDWTFRLNPNNKTGIPVLAIVSPMTEVVDFCSAKSRANLNQLTKINTYKTNDSRTYITYEQCGNTQSGNAYIYWQKGRKFSIADDIEDIHRVNLMIFYFTSDLPGGDSIAQYIAQSIKIK